MDDFPFWSLGNILEVEYEWTRPPRADRLAEWADKNFCILRCHQEAGLRGSQPWHTSSLQHQVSSDRGMNGCLAGCTFQCIFPERKCIFWNIIREDNWKKKKKTPKLFMNGKDSTQLTMLFVSYCCLVTKSCPTLVTPWTVARQAPLSMRFPRQEYCSGLPFPSLRDLPNPGIRPMTPTLQADSLPLNHQGSP